MGTDPKLCAALELPSVPKTFLSYRHESDAHKVRVRKLALDLERAAIEVVLDELADERLFHMGGPPEGWGLWSANQARECDKVLIVASAGWFEQFERPDPDEEGGRGAATEARVIRTQLQNSKWVSQRHRVVWFEHADVRQISAELQDFHRFHAEHDIANLITWLKGARPGDAPSGSPAPASWKPEDVTFQSGLADRDVEWAWTRRLLAGQTNERILLLQGESGSGKTHFFGAILRYAEQQLGVDRAASADCKGALELARVLNTLADSLDHRVLLPNFQRSGRTNASAFASDMAQVREPVALLFDTYEQSNQTVQSWIEAELLPKVRKNESLRIIVGGQKVPDHKQASLEGLVHRFELGRILEPSYWERWCAARSLHVDSHDVKVLMLGGEGTPANVAALLEAYSRRAAP
jgi:hypothetical protein